jgi:hypothetical protein
MGITPLHYKQNKHPERRLAFLQAVVEGASNAHDANLYFAHHHDPESDPPLSHDPESELPPLSHEPESDPLSQDPESELLPLSHDPQSEPESLDDDELQPLSELL